MRHRSGLGILALMAALWVGCSGGLGTPTSIDPTATTAAIIARIATPISSPTGIANPTALLLSSLRMLRHLGRTEQAESIRDSVLHIFSEGKCLTKDLGGKANTDEYKQEVISLST